VIRRKLTGSGCLKLQLSENSRVKKEAILCLGCGRLRICLTYFSKQKFLSDLITPNPNDYIFLTEPHTQLSRSKTLSRNLMT
jgi:hypothetical protein